MHKLNIASRTSFYGKGRERKNKKANQTLFSLSLSPWVWCSREGEKEKNCSKRVFFKNASQKKAGQARRISWSPQKSNLKKGKSFWRKRKEKGREGKKEERRRKVAPERWNDTLWQSLRGWEEQKNAKKVKEKKEEGGKELKEHCWKFCEMVRTRLWETEIQQRKRERKCLGLRIWNKIYKNQTKNGKKERNEKKVWKRVNLNANNELCRVSDE